MFCLCPGAQGAARSFYEWRQPPVLVGGVRVADSNGALRLTGSRVVGGRKKIGNINIDSATKDTVLFFFFSSLFVLFIAMYVYATRRYFFFLERRRRKCLLAVSGVKACVDVCDWKFFFRGPTSSALALFP